MGNSARTADPVINPPNGPMFPLTITIPPSRFRDYMPMSNALHVIPMAYTKAHLQIVMPVTPPKITTTDNSAQTAGHVTLPAAGATSPSITTTRVSHSSGIIHNLHVHRVIKTESTKARPISVLHAMLIKTNTMAKTALTVVFATLRGIGARSSNLKYWRIEKASYGLINTRYPQQKPGRVNAKL
jgi:hypothetical protein